jgi:carnitine O-acetyltransferase
MLRAPSSRFLLLRLQSTFSQTLQVLPVPPLASLRAKYLKSLKPLLSAEDYERSLRIVDEFIDGGFGEELQQRLIDYGQDKVFPS